MCVKFLAEDCKLDEEQQAQILERARSHGEPCSDAGLANLAALKSSGWGNAMELRSVIMNSPSVLTDAAQVQAWMNFLLTFGFNLRQVKHMVSEEPTLFQQDLLRCGEVMLLFRKRGLDIDGVVRLATIYPQMLWTKDENDIDKTLDILGKFQLDNGAINC